LDGWAVEIKGLSVKVFEGGVDLVVLGCGCEGTPSEKEKSTEEAWAVMGKEISDAERLDPPFQEGWDVRILDDGI
jgi:hypothetical protein